MRGAYRCLYVIRCWGCKLCPVLNNMVCGVYLADLFLRNMTNIIGKRVTLRAVEPADVEWLYKWENDTAVWGVSGTLAPFSHHSLAQFIELQQLDIFASRQMRLMITALESGATVGVVDLFEFDPLHLRAGVGILIAPTARRQGYASDALLTLEEYATQYLRLHQLWCNVEVSNQSSLKLFQSLGYKTVGVKKEWNSTVEGFVDEVMLQRLF